MRGVKVSYPVFFAVVKTKGKGIRVYKFNLDYVANSKWVVELSFNAHLLSSTRISFSRLVNLLEVKHFISTSVKEIDIVKLGIVSQAGLKLLLRSSSVSAPPHKLNLRVSNLAMLTKWWWSFLNEDESLWCKVIRSLHGPDGGLIDNLTSPLKSGCWFNVVKLKDDLYDIGLNLTSLFKKKTRNDLSTTFWLNPWMGGSPPALLPTRSNLDYRGVDLDSVLCPSCHDAIETEEHIYEDVISRPFSRFFDVVVQTTIWHLWRFRNEWSSPQNARQRPSF
ncbi:hypothetical protein Tco_0015412 [Tanacetum coccineum]